MNGADRADLPKSPPDFRILRGKTNEFMIRIYEATEPSDLLAEAFARLLPQLSERMTAPDREAVARIVASPATRQLVAAAEDGRIVGLLSVALYDVPSGRKAWIEDVVVDAATRGRGIGEALVREALALARREGVARVMLTSNATRGRPTGSMNEWGSCATRRIVSGSIYDSCGRSLRSSVSPAKGSPVSGSTMARSCAGSPVPKSKSSCVRKHAG